LRVEQSESGHHASDLHQHEETVYEKYAKYFLFPMTIMALFLANKSDWTRDLYHDAGHSFWIQFPEWFLDHNKLYLSEIFVDILLAVVFFGWGLELKQAIDDKHKGTLRSKELAVLPVVGAIGGMITPILLNMLTAPEEAADAFIAPAATDVVFALAVISFLFRNVVSEKFEAIRNFVLALAVSDDIGVSILLGIKHPSDSLSSETLLVGGVICGVAMLATYVAKRMRNESAMFYFFLACVSLYGGLRSGLHPAIGMLPVVPLLPAALFNQDLGQWQSKEHLVYGPVTRLLIVTERLEPVIIGFFAFFSAGVHIKTMGDFVSGTALSYDFSISVGKTVGITGLCALAVRLGWASWGQLSWRIIAVIAAACSIGFTVSLLVADAANISPEAADRVRLAALSSAVIGTALAAVLYQALLKGRIQTED